MLDLGVRLSELRNEHHLTQKELGDKLHLSRQSVSKWENNLAIPDIYTLLLISDIYQISLSELLDENAQSLLFTKAKLNQDNKEQVIAINEQRRKDEMMDKRTKKLLVAFVLILFSITAVISGKAAYDAHQQKVEDEAYKVTIYNVADIKYDHEKNILGMDFQYIKELTLTDGTKLENPTYDQIEDLGLFEKGKDGKKSIKHQLSMPLLTGRLTEYLL